MPSIGGVQRHTYTLARYLSRSSHEVHVVTTPLGPPSLEAEFDRNLRRLYDIEVSRKLPNRTYLPFFSAAQDIMDCLNVAKYTSKHMDNYELIHYHGARQLFFTFVQGKTPLITSIHGTFPACTMQSSKECEKRSAASCAICHIRQWPELAVSVPVMIPYYYSYHRLMEKSLKRFNKVVCVSEYVKKYIKRYLNLENLVTVYNFIDYEAEIRPQLTSLKDFDARNHMNLPPDAKIVTYFGRLSPEKGVNILLEAFRIIRKEFKSKVYLVIGGDGPQRVQLENKAREIGNVVFTGFVSRRIQIGILSQSDIFVHPATYPEAFGIAILEAMAVGLPVVATRVGGIPEFAIDGKGGYLANPNSPFDLATKISSILNDETFMSQARAYNLRLSREFDITHIGPKIVELYEKAAAQC